MSGATRVEIIAARIRQAVNSGWYISGDRLLEQNLAQQFHVSQNTIREALRLLEQEGWVVKQARHGVHVRRFSREEAEELYQLWAAVEGTALRWAIPQFDRPQFAVLRHLLDDARRAASAGDSAEAGELLFRLHSFILENCPRHQTAELLANLQNRAYLLERLRQMRLPRSSAILENTLMVYERFVNLLETRDYNAAAALLHVLIVDEYHTLRPLWDTL